MEDQKFEGRLSKVNKLLIVAVVAVVAVVGIYVTHNSGASSTTKAGSVASGNSIVTPNLSLSPSSQKVSQGSTLTVSVWADSSSTTVNAVQANLSYPANLLTYSSIDTSGSAFGVTAQATGGNGKVQIARGNATAISGKLLIAKVNFKAATNKGTAAITFTTGTALAGYTTNKDTLKSTYGGSYTLTR